MQEGREKIACASFRDPLSPLLLCLVRPCSLPLLSMTNVRGKLFHGQDGRF
jgi:hypothetical protein